MLFDYGKTQILPEMDHFVSKTFFPRHLTIWNENHQHHNVLLVPNLKMFERRKWKLFNLDEWNNQQGIRDQRQVKGNNPLSGGDGGGGWMTH